MRSILVLVGLVALLAVVVLVARQPVPEGCYLADDYVPVALPSGVAWDLSHDSVRLINGERYWCLGE
jgi:hypothetical protein